MWDFAVYLYKVWNIFDFAGSVVETMLFIQGLPLLLLNQVGGLPRE